MKKQGYLIAKYGYHECSECGTKYTEDEYWNYYCIKKIMKWHINCKNCGISYHENPKRCYWNEHYGNKSNGCGDQIEIDGVIYCTRQLTARKAELRTWGCYYPCECFESPKEKEEFKQLSFF